MTAGGFINIERRMFCLCTYVNTQGICRYVLFALSGSAMLTTSKSAPAGFRGMRSAFSGEEETPRGLGQGSQGQQGWAWCGGF